MGEMQNLKNLLEDKKSNLLRREKKLKDKELTLVFEKKESKKSNKVLYKKLTKKDK